MARVFDVSQANGLTVQNGIAYGLVAGGATSFIPEELHWYTGTNFTEYFNMLRSRGRDVSEVIAVLSLRGACSHAAATHAAELGPLVANGALQLNAAEQMDDARMRELTVYAKLNPAEHNAAHYTAVTANATAAAPTGAWRADRLSAKDVASLRDSDHISFAAATARMTYSIIAINALGLISSGHHLRGSALSTLQAIFRMYELTASFKAVGVTERAMLSLLGHDTLHPLSYGDVAVWGQAIPTSAAAKIAAPVMMRLPAYPGGTAFVKNSLQCWKVVRGAALLTALADAVEHSDGFAALTALDVAIKQNPLEYSALFRPARKAVIDQSVARVSNAAIVIMAAYEAYVEHTKLKVEGGDGPTGGSGMLKFKADNLTAYATAKAVADAQIETNSATVSTGLTVLDGLLA